MRRKYLGLAIAAIATLGPAQAWGGDREIAEEIIERLKAKRDSGALKDFTLDMKVDQGVVLFRGSVSEAAQKQLVLKAADGVDGIARVVDEVKVTSGSETAPKAAIAEAKPEPAAGKSKAASGFSFRQALAARAEAIRGGAQSAPATPAVAKAARGVVPGVVMPTAATEPAEASEPVEASEAADDDVTAAVVMSLRQAKQSGQLKGFGVDVQAAGGVVELSGQAGSKAQRDLIVRLAENTPGVSDVRESIQVAQVNAELPRLPQPPMLQEPPAAAGDQLAPVTVEAAPVSHQRVAGPVRATAARRPAAGRHPAAARRPAAGRHPAAGRRVPARPAAAQMQGAPMGSAPVMGQPVPMSPPTMGAGAPRYDSPYLPNYAWPGYAAYPNYAAVSYPQQYSPSAWPYIGPFYPYPQVPLGWRRVSLEWDDGWWFLDFTDK